MKKVIAKSGVSQKEFPSTPLVVTGARLDQIRKTVFEKNPIEQAGIAAGRKLIVGSPQSMGTNTGFNPCGARHYLSRDEGSGYWDMLYIMDGLLVSIADAQYRQRIDTHWPDDKVLKVRLTLSGRMLDTGGQILSGPGDCTINSFSGHREIPYQLDAVDEPFQSVCIHLSRPVLELLHLDSSVLQDPFLSLYERDELPDSHYKLTAPNTLIGLAREMVESRDRFSANTRRLYLGARALEILVTVIEQYRSKAIPNTGANRVSQRDVSRIHEAHRILGASYAAPPSIQELARLVGINTTKLKLGFREIFGTTVQGFIIQQRMENGLLLIENTDLSISEIGYRVGYSYPASFTQAIRKHYGKTPQALRGES
ncbi:transcriptional regulator, AraC family [Luminiphilus syltensis NOR5-1B]|uniref:Transcriptional regulator, AraC family n=1 Tax=Luminiphilus syltensis NOR5-1B TaxID=565045 RepID=B8KY29_9GAMM|nr:AraC family transcriptional regulator [Luminiphilus syltensis]EED34879.1 transcriptional regulator, AraC family [Luminiphilus syltensis NOR5-1B]